MLMSVSSSLAVDKPSETSAPVSTEIRPDTIDDSDQLLIPTLPEIDLEEFVVVGSTINKVRDSAYNATALDAAQMANSTKTVGDALSKAPGMKIRQSGGEGSDMNVSMDGFAGKHVKVFIDGVAQEGVGAAFSLNNIPVSMAESIEVYRGVVPVSFGGDAIGGVVNIVTKKRPNKWVADASYSFGSYGTHKSHLTVGNTFDSGLRFEVTAFQNYSDNDYKVLAPVEDFTTGAINRRKKEKVRRFHDRYHNEAVVGKVGVVGKSWADQLMLNLTYSQMYKEVQTGVRQEIVYGGKYRRGNSIIPSLIYQKRNLIVDGLDLTVNANFNRNLTANVDTSSYKYNWRGESQKLNSPGEQMYQHQVSHNNNWNSTVTLNYRPSWQHLVTLNNLYAGFHRRNENRLTSPSSFEEIAKLTQKDIIGLAYRYTPVDAFNVSVFAKQYYQHVAGPQATSASSDSFKRSVKQTSNLGYGMAAAWTLPYSILEGNLQMKASYEKAYRLPTVEEMFGDEDLEQGDMTLRPESSHNANLSASYNAAWGEHALFAEVGGIYRDTRDYIQRNIMALSGGKSAATYVNYGRVLTTGLTVNARYDYSKWVGVGGSFTRMNARDHMRYINGSGTPNVAYGQRMPNLPWMFADGDVTLHWPGLGGKGNRLSLIYDAQYTHSFCYYSSNLGSNSADYMVPNQLAHNVSLAYQLQDGRYTLSLECRNLTDALLYDNFSLQKAGRGFYAKVRFRL